jgi:hypothetical protein
MFAAFVVGPVGGLIAMVSSVWLALRWGKGVVPVGWMLLRTASALAAIAALVVAIIALRLYTLDTYTNTLPPTLEFEIRIPATLPVPDRSSLRVEVHTDKNVDDGELGEHWSPGDGAHQVIGGRVSLTRKTWSRLLVVSTPGQPTRLFKVSLPRDPQTTPTLSQWRRPDLIAVEGEEMARAAPADDPFEMRFRVRCAGDD